MSENLKFPQKGREDYWNNAEFVEVGSKEHIEYLERLLNLYDDEPDNEFAIKIKKELMEIKEKRE